MSPPIITPHANPRPGSRSGSQNHRRTNRRTRDDRKKASDAGQIPAQKTRPNINARPTGTMRPMRKPIGKWPPRAATESAASGSVNGTPRIVVDQIRPPLCCATSSGSPNIAKNPSLVS